MEGKIGLDLGNSMIEVAAKVNDQIMLANIPSVVDIRSGDNSMAITDSVAVVECDDTTIILGQGMPLVSIDKTKRSYIKHQILYAVFKALGAGNHTIELATGLPINLYKAKKDSFQEQLSKFEKISGIVNGKHVSVEIQKVLVRSEGHSSLLALKQKVTHATPILVVDIGYKTVDTVKFRWDEASKKFVTDGYETFDNCALYNIYRMLAEYLAQYGGVYQIEEIDARLHSDYPMFRTSSGNTINLKCNLAFAKDVYSSLIRNLENVYGQLYQYDLLFVGGGSEIFLEGLNAMKDDEKPEGIHIIETTAEEKYFANALGYLAALK